MTPKKKALTRANMPCGLDALRGDARRLGFFDALPEPVGFARFFDGEPALLLYRFSATNGGRRRDESLMPLPARH